MVTPVITLRVESPSRALAERIAAKLRAEHGIPATRASVLKHAIELGLPILAEREHVATEPPPKAKRSGR